MRPDLRIVGVQAAERSRTGYTIADGIAVKNPGELTMSILDETLDEIVSVTDEEISEAIVLLLERTKLVVEGAGAVGVAALLSGKVGGAGRGRAPILSGGNIDASLLISVMRHGLAAAGRYLVLRTRVPDRPGELAKLLTLLANDRVNVVEVEHQREDRQSRRGDRRRADAAHARSLALRRDRRESRALGLPRASTVLALFRVTPCPVCGHDNASGAKFCSECGAALVAASERREERKVVTVLFADLVGFTSRAETLDPEDVRAVLAPYWERLRAELERFGGTVEKFIGDAVMALFGAPVSHEDDPERAVRAALAIRDWAREEDDLQVRIAVNTGEALVRSAHGRRRARGWRPATS